jgi:hypothetical protein
MDKKHAFEWPNGAIKPVWSGSDVVGCGLVLNPHNQLAIFFTVNGILMGKFLYSLEIGRDMQFNRRRFVAETFHFVSCEILNIHQLPYMANLWSLIA